MPFCWKIRYRLLHQLKLGHLKLIKAWLFFTIEFILQYICTFLGLFPSHDKDNWCFLSSIPCCLSFFLLFLQVKKHKFWFGKVWQQGISAFSVVEGGCWFAELVKLLQAWDPLSLKIWLSSWCFCDCIG